MGGNGTKWGNWGPFFWFFPCRFCFLLVGVSFFSDIKEANPYIRNTYIPNISQAKNEGGRYFQ